MIRRDFIKYCFGALSTFCLTGNFGLEKDDEDYYYNETCLGKYRSHTISYNLDVEKYYYLGNYDTYLFRYLEFPIEYILTIYYSNFDIILLSYNIKLEDIPLIISKKPKDLVLKNDEIIIKCKKHQYKFKPWKIEINNSHNIRKSDFIS